MAAHASNATPATASAAGPARVARERRVAEPAAARPAVRRVERPSPEPEPIAVSHEQAQPPAAAEAVPARGLLRRVAGALRTNRRAPADPPPGAGVVARAPAPPAAGERPRMAVRDAAPPAAAAAAASPLAAAIARSGLGAVDAADGSASVTFPVPGGPAIPEYVPFSTAPVTMSRSLADLAEGAARGAISDAGTAVRERADDAVADAGTAVRERAGSAVDAVSGALPGGQSSRAGDADKTFEELYDRLKRELMSEQEQLGQLFHEP